MKEHVINFLIGFSIIGPMWGIMGGAYISNVICLKLLTGILYIGLVVLSIVCTYLVGMGIKDL